MDERHLMAAVRYVELNPVRARLCKRPEDWSWSSIHAHLIAKDVLLTTVSPMLQRVANWRAYLSEEKMDHHDDTETLRKHTRSGRPVGDPEFVARLECLTGRTLRKRKPGPKSVDK